MSLLLWTILGAGAGIPPEVGGVMDSALLWLNPSGIGSASTRLNNDPLSGSQVTTSLTTGPTTGNSITTRLTNDPLTGSLGD